jgi:hypothetical protein
MLIKKIFLNFVFFFFLFQNFSHAGAVQVSQWIPWSFLSSEMVKTPISLTQNESSIQLSFGELSPVARTLSLSIDGDLGQVQIDAQGIEASSTNLSAKIVIKELVINQMVVRNISGNMINVQVNATCSPITIIVEEFDAQLSGEFVQSDNWNINLHNVALTFPVGKWTVGSMSCSGLSGVDQQITSMIADNLKNPAIIQDFLKASLAPVISESWTKQWTSLVTSAKGTLSNIQIQQPSNQGLHITAEIPLSSDEYVELPAMNQYNLSTSKPQFLLSSAGFSALLKDKLLGLAPQKYNLQNVLGFYNLMRSPFKQLLVFPDLKKFSYDAYFGLSTNKDASTLTLSNKTAKTYSARLKTKGVVAVKKSSKEVPYIDWTIDLTTTLLVAMKDSKLTLKTGTPSTNINWLFNQNYLNTYATNTRVSSGVITSSILSAFTAQSTTQTLPTLSWQGRELKLQSWTQDRELITMDWVE